jgi:hypothetical protein
MAVSQVAPWTLSAGGSGATIDITLLGGKQVQISSLVVAGGGHKVTWAVTNSSGADETVKVEDFCLKNAADPGKHIADTPLDSGQPLIDFGLVRDGDTTVQTTKIKASKNGYRGAWVYKYTLVVGTTRIDPELVIEWP